MTQISLTKNEIWCVRTKNKVSAIQTVSVLYRRIEFQNHSRLRFMAVRCSCHRWFSTNNKRCTIFGVRQIDFTAPTKHSVFYFIWYVSKQHVLMESTQSKIFSPQMLTFINNQQHHFAKANPLLWWCALFKSIERW